MHVGGTSKVFVTRKADEAYVEECLLPKFRKLAACMVWAGISSTVKGPLLHWDKAKWENITAQGYIDHILPLLKRYHEEVQQAVPGQEVIIMQDYAPVHTAHLAMTWFLDHGFGLMNWPPYSPDLNPIENIWSIIKGCIFRRSSRPTTVPEMRVTIDEEWARLKQS